jgi:hypothetical protein
MKMPIGVRPTIPILRALVVLGLLVLVLAACGNSQGTTQPILTQHQVIGTWTSQSGSSLTFEPAHELVVKHVDIGPAVPGCGSASGAGTWQFLSLKGVSGSSPTTYKQGNLIMVLMPSIPEHCNGWGITTWGTSSSVRLCVASDPDSPCTSETFARQ